MRVAAPAWMILCIVMGGAVSSGILVNGLLQIASGGVIIALLIRSSSSDLDRPARLLLAIVGVVAVYALLTLVPLPPPMWRNLGGRGELLGDFSLLHMPAPWLPISMVPDGTIAALLSLLPPLATFLLVYASPPEGRLAAVIAVAAATFASVLFGVVQQFAGYSSSLYVYQFSSRGGAVGFFANRNHLATLCLMTVPFLAAFIALGRRKRDRVEPGRWLPAFFALLLLIVGALIVQSRAGWILLVPTSLASILIVQGSRRGWSRGLMAGVVVVLAIAIAAALFAPISTADLNDVSGEVSAQQRRVFMKLTWQAIEHFWPSGTGLGSFTQVYPQFEQPATVTNTFINHAHNDYLEFLLENGVVGAVIIAAFVIWWGGRVRAVWRSGGDPIARGATVAIGVLLAHSFVDYPVRTAAIGSVVALCCALTSAPARRPEPQRRGKERLSGVIMMGMKGRGSPRGSFAP